MEILFDFLLTVGISLLVSFLLAELLSMIYSIEDGAVFKPSTVANINNDNDREDKIPITVETIEDSSPLTCPNNEQVYTKVDDVVENESTDVKEQQRVLDKGDTCLEIEIDSVDEEEEELFDDDWEGVERTELEKRFGDAVVFVGSKNNVGRLQSEVKLELCGLHKVALEGTCLKPQPMAFQLSARAKWNAWQRLGNMSREVAMEQYIALLSRSIPGWMGDDSSEQPGVESDRKLEESNTRVGERDAIGVEAPIA